MAQLFRTAKQNRIFQDVVEQIQNAIIDGRIKVGEKLPAERELKEMLRTSRSTLREALRVLEQKGLIKMKLGMGGGAIVKAVSSDKISESLDLLIRSQKVSLNHIAEFRERVEGSVAAIAAQRATKDHIKKLKQLLEAARACDQSEAFLFADKAFHLYLAEITGNPLYIAILKIIHDNIIRYYDMFLTMEERERRENLADLEQIVSAIETGDAGKASDLVHAHVSRFNCYMEEQEKQIQG